MQALARSKHRAGLAGSRFESDTPGAFSDIATRQPQVPALRYDNSKPKGLPYVKFDGYQELDNGVTELIDAKTRIVPFSTSNGPFISPSVRDGLVRKSEALRQNTGYIGVIELPTQATRREARGTAGSATARDQQHRNEGTFVGFSMQMEARFRRRARAEESIAALNAGLLGDLSGVAGLWASNEVATNAQLDLGTGESAAVDLSPHLIATVEGAISYASRLPQAIVDRATSDDSLVLRFDSDAVDLQWFTREVFPEVVRIFGAYRAAIVTDVDQDLDDYDDIVREVQRTGLDVDGRDTVWRFQSINFFDAALCRKAFGIDAREVVNRLSDLAGAAESFESGVLIVTTKAGAANAVTLESEIRSRLRGSRHAN